MEAYSSGGDSHLPHCPYRGRLHRKPHLDPLHYKEDHRITTVNTHHILRPIGRVPRHHLVVSVAFEYFHILVCST